MAKGSAKRIASANQQKLQILQYGFLASQTIYAVAFFLFTSLRPWNRLLLHGLSTAAAGALWYQLASMARSGDELSQAGLTSYIFDFIYITWAIHVLSAWITFKFYWLYASVPAYVFYKAWTLFLYPRFFAGLGGPKSPNAPAAEKPAISKRQAKFKERYGDGQPPVKYARK